MDMSKDFVWLGNDVYIPYGDITLLTDYYQPAAKKLVKQAKEDGLLMDYSRGQGKETVALLKNGAVITTGVELQRVLNATKDDENK